jgi:uncharacterized membrane protein YraQ (UPF0718 family)
MLSSLSQVLSTAGHMFLHLWYFLALGIIIGSVISVYLPRRKLSSLARESSFKGILIAALAGAISPLGSYAVIPIFTVMLSTGMPKAIVMTFLVSSPLINPVIFILTWTVISPSMALARLFSAILLGILCGVAVDFLSKGGFFKDKTPRGSSEEPGSANEGEARRSDGDPGERVALPTFPEEEIRPENRLKAALIMMWKTAKYPGRYFLLAILLAALLDVFVPRDTIARYMGTGHTSILIAAAMGIPLYMCGGGAIPLVAQFLEMGMDHGAALTFLVVGPATRIAPMVTVFSLVRKRVFLVYFLVVLLGGMAAGFVYGLFF